MTEKAAAQEADVPDPGLDAHGDEILEPGQIGARHVDQAWLVTPIKKTLEMAEAQGRTVIVFLLRRWVKQLERAFYAREQEIRRRQLVEAESARPPS